ncbi:hypothetical protein NDU88_006519 [Pleurodeles waltl]|uniref:Uncharacterized protein n=1 Tax=Pleurodeles waltl TaxID=8319 RepID=A0AAV7MCG5_PLEWA|nr:hypothetical protein NDU88_006519 [Pleurodeles waltl]
MRGTVARARSAERRRRRRSVEVHSFIEVGWSSVVEGFVSVDEDFEDDPFADGQPVKGSEVSGGVFVAWEVEYGTCSCVLDSLEFLLKLGCGTNVEGVSVV